MSIEGGLGKPFPSTPAPPPPVHYPLIGRAQIAVTHAAAATATAAL